MISAHDLVHMIPRDEWEGCAQQETYEPSGYATDGYVHLSERWQVHHPANFLFSQRHDILLLIFDKTVLADKLCYEPGEEGDTMEFPHYYGHLPLFAVIAVEEYFPNENGEFEAYPVA